MRCLSLLCKWRSTLSSVLRPSMAKPPLSVRRFAVASSLSLGQDRRDPKRWRQFKFRKCQGRRLTAQECKNIHSAGSMRYALRTDIAPSSSFFTPTTRSKYYSLSSESPIMTTNTCTKDLLFTFKQKQWLSLLSVMTTCHPVARRHGITRRWQDPTAKQDRAGPIGIKADT